MTAPKLYLFRHGETAWSISGQHTGRTDLPLTPRGEEMALALAPALAGISFAKVLTSPRQRAGRTCELAGLGAQVEIEPDLAEWDYGDYEGLRTAEIRALRPGWDVWCDGCPNGESPAGIVARADRLVRRLLPFSGNLALFSHGHFGRILAARWVGLQGTDGQRLVLDPATISILGFDPGHPEQRVIAMWNAPPRSL